jgi:hypothetical protein
LDFIVLYNIKKIDEGAFKGCGSLKTVTLGTEFTKPEMIEMGLGAFWRPPDSSLRSEDDEDLEETKTEEIELTLGEFVLPKPEGNNWHGYTWKNIVIEPAPTGIKEVIKSDNISLYPNPAKESATVSFELEKTSDIKISLMDVSGKEIAVVYKGFADAGIFVKTFSTGHLPGGVYLLNVSVNGNDTVKKIIVK